MSGEAPASADVLSANAGSKLRWGRMVGRPKGAMTAKNQGAQVKLLNLTKKVKDVLQLTKLYTVFDIYDDEASAIGSFK